MSELRQGDVKAVLCHLHRYKPTAGLGKSHLAQLKGLHLSCLETPLILLISSWTS